MIAVLDAIAQMLSALRAFEPEEALPHAQVLVIRALHDEVEAHRSSCGRAPTGLKPFGFCTPVGSRPCVNEARIRLHALSVAITDTRERV